MRDRKERDNEIVRTRRKLKDRRIERKRIIITK